MTELVKEKGGSVILMSPPPMSSWELQAEDDSLNLNKLLLPYVKSLKDISEEENTLFVDHFHLWKDQDYHRWLPDGVHPNEEGQAELARALFATICKTVY